MSNEPDNETVTEPPEDQTMGPYRDVYLQALMEQHQSESKQQAEEIATAAESEPEEGPSAPVWEVEAEEACPSATPRESRKAALVAALLEVAPDDE